MRQRPESRDVRVAVTGSSGYDSSASKQKIAEGKRTLAAVLILVGVFVFLHLSSGTSAASKSAGAKQVSAMDKASASGGSSGGSSAGSTLQSKPSAAVLGTDRTSGGDGAKATSVVGQTAGHDTQETVGIPASIDKAQLAAMGVPEPKVSVQIPITQNPVKQISQPALNSGSQSSHAGGLHMANGVMMFQDCKDLWQADELVGRCFGLKNYTKLTAGTGIEMTSPDAAGCKQLCCDLGDKCISWQYWKHIGVCKVRVYYIFR